MEKTPGVQWHVVENDGEWPAAVAGDWRAVLHNPATSSTAEDSPRRRHWLKRGFICLVLAGVLALLGMLLWRRAEETLERVGDELTLAATAEEWAWSEDQQAIATALIDETADPAWQRAAKVGAWLASSTGDAAEARTTIAAQTTELRGDKAMVRMLLTKTVLGEPARQYRETRFYRASRKGWVHTAPVPALCGSPQAYATAHLAFRYHRCDEAAVQAVAGSVDQAYMAMLADWALPASTASPHLTIEVALAVPGTGDLPETGHLIVTSPTVQRIPADLTDAEVLQQSIINSLVDHTLIAAFHYHVPATAQDSQLQVQPLFRTLRTWQLWHQGGPLARWRERLVTWSLPLAHVDTATRISLPEGYERLCDLNRLWAFLPTGVDLPLTCAPADATAYPKFVVGPRDLFSAASRYDENCHLHYMCYARRNQGETIAAVSLLEYLLSEYGGRLLPDIIRAFEKRDTWAELIRELPGLQETAVRAGWCSYLAREYGVSDCPVFDH